MKTKFVKLYGCPCCGSEHTEEEKEKALREGNPCRFCSSEEHLEYLGEFNERELIS
jgi:hypothetical protein